MLYRVSRGAAHQHADAARSLGRGDTRPVQSGSRHCRTDKRDELAPLHSITSSANASSIGGTSSPSALAVLRLITSSNLVGCWTGSSAGLAPRRTRSTYDAALR